VAWSVMCCFVASCENTSQRPCPAPCCATLHRVVQPCLCCATLHRVVQTCPCCATLPCTVLSSPAPNPTQFQNLLLTQVQESADSSVKHMNSSSCGAAKAMCNIFFMSVFFCVSPSFRILILTIRFTFFIQKSFLACYILQCK